MSLQQAAAVLREYDRMVAMTGHADGLDQPLFAEVAEVARTRISRPIVVVAKVTTGDNSKGANGRERAGLGPAQGVLTIAVANEVPLRSAWQTDVPCECVPWLVIALTAIAFSLGPTGIVVAFLLVLTISLPIVPCTAAECPRVIAI